MINVFHMLTSWVYTSIYLHITEHLLKSYVMYALEIVAVKVNKSCYFIALTIRTTHYDQCILYTNFFGILQRCSFTRHCRIASKAP